MRERLASKIYFLFPLICFSELYDYECIMARDNDLMIAFVYDN